MNSDLITHLPPAFILIFGGLILPFFQENAKRILVLLMPSLALAQSWMLPSDLSHISFSIAGFDLSLLHHHSYSLIFATIFCFMAFAGGLFGLTTASLMESSAALIYAGGALGVVFSGDLIAFFLYWELMAVASAIVIFCGGRTISRQAGLRYCYMHFIGGVILLSGIASYILLSGSTSFTSLESNMHWMLTLTPDAYTISLWLMLVGIAINAAVPPLSAWLADSYPSASATGSVFLSAFTTKTAVFALLILFAGNELLIYLGLATLLYGLIYAMLQNNIRRTLSYGLISQIGVMITGIGVGSDLALLAVSLVAFGHILYKGLWFMVAGAVIESTNRRNVHELGALWHHHKLLASFAIIATAAMLLPFTSGFIGKALLSAALHQHETDVKTAYLLITASAAGMFLILTRLFYSIFLGTTPSSPAKIKPLPLNMYLAMGAMALFSILPSIPIAYEHLLAFTITPSLELPTLYKTSYILAHLEIAAFSLLAFLLLKPWLATKSFILLDVDWFYRVFAKRVLQVVLARVHYHYWGTALSHGKQAATHIILGAYKVHGPKGLFSRSWNISTTALWSVLLLGLYLALYYSA